MPDYFDIDEPVRYGFCKSCKCNVQTGEIDEGFDHEFGFHSIVVEVCRECGTETTAPIDEEI